MPKAKAARPAKIEKLGKLRKPSSEDIQAEEDAPVFLPDDLGVEMPEPSAFLSSVQSDGRSFGAADIYKKTWDWLKQYHCAAYVSPQLIERYAVSAARWEQCEEMTSKLGMMAKHPTSGKPVASPFVEMGISYMNQSLKLWNDIVQIVKTYGYGTDGGESSDLSEDFMGRLI